MSNGRGISRAKAATYAYHQRLARKQYMAASLGRLRRPLFISATSGAEVQSPAACDHVMRDAGRHTRIWNMNTLRKGMRRLSALQTRD